MIVQSARLGAVDWSVVKDDALLASPATAVMGVTDLAQQTAAALRHWWQWGDYTPQTPVTPPTPVAPQTQQDMQNPDDWYTNRMSADQQAAWAAWRQHAFDTYSDPGLAGEKRKNMNLLWAGAAAAVLGVVLLVKGS